MSFILDALRKAERDRHLGQPPSLVEMGRAPALLKPAPSSHRSWILLALIVVMAVVLIALARAPATTSENSAVVMPAAAVPAVAPPLLPPPEMARPPALAPLPKEFAQAPLAEIPALDVDADFLSLDDLIDEAAPAPVEATSAEPAPPVSVAASDWSDDQGQPAPAPIPLDGDTEASGTKSRDIESAEPADGTDLQTLARPEQVEAAAVPVAAGPRLLRDMPVEFRSSFPAVQIDVHVHDDDPLRRWVLVQGRRYAEGDTLPQGARVEAITARGTVLGWLDQDILIPLTP